MDIVFASLFSGFSFMICGFNYHYSIYRPKKTERNLIIGFLVFFFLPLLLAVLFKLDAFTLAAVCGFLASLSGLTWLYRTSKKVAPYDLLTTLIISLIPFVLSTIMLLIWVLG
jgi:hypothetical protein